MSILSTTSLKKAVSGKKVLIDTNVIIYLTEAVQPYCELSGLLFEMVESEKTEAVFSLLSIAEVIQGPLQMGNNPLANQVKEYLFNFPNAACQEITNDVINFMGKDSKVDWSKLRVNDSLIVASGLYQNVDKVISNDRHFFHALPKNYLISFDTF
jgi:predicted nucleic acid-binding protein